MYERGMQIVAEHEVDLIGCPPAVHCEGYSAIKTNEACTL